VLTGRQYLRSSIRDRRLQGQSPMARLFKYGFSYKCAAADKIFSDIWRRAVAV